MPKYCPSCGKPIEEHFIFCPYCGTKITSPVSQAAPSPVKNDAKDSVVLPEADSLISLNHAAGIISILLGILFLIFGILTVIAFFGIFFIVFGIIDMYIWGKLKEINALLRNKNYRHAKSDQLTWAVIGFFLGGIIIGIILFICYLKYDELIRLEQEHTQKQ